MSQFPRPEYDSFLGQLLEDISDQRIEPLGAVQDGVDPLESANFDAFIAQLFALGIDTALCRYGEDAMHCAFVYDHSDQQQSLHDAYIITAAQWILVSSSAMYASCQENQWTLTMTKWAKWREGFLSVAEDAQHGAECRKIAERVADMMALEEKAAKG
ncbi:hypothetical protein BDZ85DRAFT_106326 [Elsinoe ampelina]|uniref:Uncharacterized protein n=1 Tax=Elsinoe ampelina TaxID=302913 RepID=A0A6A6FXR9_9PEZI|nr:hypothetical protein BDZ85DRAFT_106326 [Elsinoe ampelina]